MCGSRVQNGAVPAPLASYFLVSPCECQSPATLASVVPATCCPCPVIEPGICSALLEMLFPIDCEPAPLTLFRFKYEPLIEDITGCASVNFTPSLWTFDCSYPASLICFPGFFPPFHLSLPNTIYMLLISLVDRSLSVTGLTFLRAW